jgi:AhpD family alkylhydroperoxidase
MATTTQTCPTCGERYDGDVRFCPRDGTRLAAGSASEGRGSLEEFRRFRERMNREILDENNLVINRFFALDGRAYESGALDVRTKELLGLVASLVLRCDDCVTYHLVRCREEGVGRGELFEALGVGLVVGGSIVIPHLRHAVETLDLLRAREKRKEA